MRMLSNSFIQVLVIFLAGFYSSNDTAGIHFANHSWTEIRRLFEFGDIYICFLNTSGVWFEWDKKSDAHFPKC